MAANMRHHPEAPGLRAESTDIHRMGMDATLRRSAVWSLEL